MTGTLMIIGGGEDRDPKGERAILKEIARRVHGGKLVLATVASREPRGYYEEYRDAFADLGLGELVELYVENRCEAADRDKLAVMDDAAAVFFTGGDQLRITSHLGGSPLCTHLHELYWKGRTIAGTSAGAAAMPDTMMIWGGDDS